MDAIGKNLALKCVSSFTDNGFTVTQRKPMKIRRKSSRNSCRLSDVLIPEDEVLDNKQLKCCSVILQKLTNDDLKKYLAANIYPTLFKTEKQLEFKSLEILPRMTTNLETDSGSVNLNLNVDEKFLATEDHLDLLMAKEMRSSKLKIEQRLRNSTFVNEFNSTKMKPVVVLERLSPQFIAQAVNGKSGKEEEHQEITQLQKEIILAEQKKAVTTGIRRSERLSSSSYRHSNISMPSDRHSCFCNKRNSDTPRRFYSDIEVFRSEENIAKHKRKRAGRKPNYSDDEEEFLGFEFPDRNRHRTNKMKKTLKTLCAYTTGKENKKMNILKGETKNRSRQKTPLRAFNRIEKMFRVPESISVFKDKHIRNEHPFRGFDMHADRRNIENEIYRNHRLEDNYISNDLTAEKLEILRLFKKREKTKLLMSGVIQDQRRYLKHRKFVGGRFFYSSLDYYSSDLYLLKTGKRVPFWGEESVTKAIMSCQEQIPVDLIASYFHNSQPLTITNLFYSF